MNFSKAGEGESTLLSFDDARTLFHEFGHALHALVSDVTYPLISGTNVLTDWVELPSQLYEHWLQRPEILRQFALHCDTGEPIPEDLLRRLLDARTFNQGFATVEYLASALVDLDVHSQSGAENFDITRFEQASLARIGMPAEIVMRHRPTHFTHVFAGDSYASAYYSYMWSEVMDADAFAAFEETGDVFDPATAAKPARQRLCGGRLARSGRALHCLPRPAADARRAVAAAGIDRGACVTPPWTSTPPDIAGASCARRITPPPRPGARSSPKAATRSKPWWRWRRRSPPSIRT